MNVPEISQKIEDLFHILKQTQISSEEIASKINSILIHGDKVSLNYLSASWDFFAKNRGLYSEKNSKEFK